MKISLQSTGSEISQVLSCKRPDLTKIAVCLVIGMPGKQSCASLIVHIHGYESYHDLQRFYSICETDMVRRGK